MKSYQLIFQLLKSPTKEVGFVYDGALRGAVDRVWVTRHGEVALSGEEEPVYYDEDRPKWAPDSDQESYWSMP
jgi:hypothetical protein